MINIKILSIRYGPLQAAMFLSCLATDICVGLGSWVDTEKELEENSDKAELQYLFDVLRFDSCCTDT